MRLPLPNNLVLTLLCILYTPQVSANTEIVNFGIIPGPDVTLPQASIWPRLSSDEHEQLFNVIPAPLGTALEDICEPQTYSPLGACPHALWLSIGTEDPAWAPYSKFTLRVSWPASSPADFYINTYSPESLGALVYGRNTTVSGGALTRRIYACIRLVSTGVLTPSHAHRYPAPGPVPFMVIVEPLYFGVLPASVVPTIIAVVAVTTAAWLFVVPPVSRYLMSIAGFVRAETLSERGQNPMKRQ